jgi:hypothetical protein
MLLAVLLLSASSWAAVCDVECTVQRSQGCQASQVSSQKDRLVSKSHAHCANMRKPDASKAGPASFVEATSTCTHSLCRQPASLVDPAKSMQFDRVQWAIVHQILTVEQGFVSGRYVSEAPPPVVVPPPDPLSVALRI